VFIDNGFRETVTYTLRRDIKKTVVYFVARFKKFKEQNMKLVRQPEEISAVRWVEIDKASAFLAFENDRTVVSKAKAFIALYK
jgi:hypothetical protein